MIKKLLAKFSHKDKSKELLERVIFENNYHRLYKLAYSITRDSHIAQDVVQETFIKAFDKLHTLKDEEKFESWLAIICSRKAKDFLRKSKRWNDFATSDVFIDSESLKNEEVNTVETVIEHRFLKQYIREKIATMKPEYQEVLILKYEYELKETEIAEALEINIGTVKSRLHRAKKYLKELIESSEEAKEGIIS